MEAFIVAIFLIVTLVMGTENKQRESDWSQSIETATSKDQFVDRVLTVKVCDPDSHQIIQRDLTVPLNKQAGEDDQ